MDFEAVTPSPPFILAATIGTATLLAYLLMRGESDGQTFTDERFKGKEYFSAILDAKDADQLAIHSGIEQGCRWSQTETEVEVCVPLAAGVRGKECRCKVLEDKLTITVPGAEEPGVLSEAVQVRRDRNYLPIHAPPCHPGLTAHCTMTGQTLSTGPGRRG